VLYQTYELAFSFQAPCAFFFERVLRVSFVRGLFGDHVQDDIGQFLGCG